MDEYKKNHNGQSWNPEYPNQNTEEQTLSKIMIEQFMEILFEKDKKYLIAKFHKRYIYNIFSKYKKPNFKETQQHINKPNERSVLIMNYNDYDVLTAHEAMNYLGIGENSIYRLLKSGELGAFRIGRTWKIPIKELDKYIDESVTKNLKN